MRKTIVTMIATLVAAPLLTATVSSAATYKFNFQSSDAELTATGEFTVNSANEVTGVSGAVAGLTNQTISGVFANPSFPNSSTSPDGLFIYDNLYSSTGMAFDYSGLLFTTADNAGYWNLWASSPGTYSLYEFGWRLLPDRGKRNAKRRWRAGAVNLGDAGFGLFRAHLRRPPPAHGAPGAQPRLKATRLQGLRGPPRRRPFLCRGQRYNRVCEKIKPVLNRAVVELDS